jgi:hypothetical protein
MNDQDHAVSSELHQILYLADREFDAVREEEAWEEEAWIRGLRFY